MSTGGIKPSPAGGSTVPRRQLGRHLRELRQETGLSIVEVAKLIDRGSGTLQRLETGAAERIRLTDIEALCKVLDADAVMTEGLKGLAQQSNSSESWWHEYGDLIPADFDVYIGLESAASRLTSFQELVPGLFQIPRYAETLIRAARPEDSPAEIVRRVEMKMRRQRLLTRKRRPLAVDMVLDESVLHRRIGNAKVMSDQLRRLADLSTLPNITLRVLPYSAGVPLGDLTGPFTVLEFTATAGREERPVIYSENFVGAFYFERRDSVERYRSAHAAMRDAALDEQASRDLLRRGARER